MIRYSNFSSKCSERKKKNVNMKQFLLIFVVSCAMVCYVAGQHNEFKECYRSSNEVVDPGDGFYTCHTWCGAVNFKTGSCYKFYTGNYCVCRQYDSKWCIGLTIRCWLFFCKCKIVGKNVNKRKCVCAHVFSSFFILPSMLLFFCIIFISSIRWCLFYVTLNYV